VEGKVFDATGRAVASATVTMRGEGWSTSRMTDSQGYYGFSGLCSGAAILQASLPGGRTSAAVSVSLTGQNNVLLDLKPVLENTGLTPQPTRTEAEMPVTGFSSWLLAGGAGLAVILLLAAGARRMLGRGEAANSQD
jgi:hypothetical protein